MVDEDSKDDSFLRDEEMLRFNQEMTKAKDDGFNNDLIDEAKILKQIEEADAEIRHYTLANAKLNVMNDVIVDGASKLFEELGGEPDLFKNLAGSTEVT